MQNDLVDIKDLGSMIKCLVFDEAHKAKGNHPYCEIIKKLYPKWKYFRVLALSATPGNTTNDTLQVMRNLLISHLEIRTDESLDVSPYVFKRKLETIVIPLGSKIQQVHDEFIKVKFFKFLEELIYIHLIFTYRF